jgi:RHS repeat-associated protein
MRPTSWNVSNVLGYNYSYLEHTDKVNYARAVYDSTLDRSYEYDQVGALVFAHSGAEARAAFGIDGQQWGTSDGPYSHMYDYDKQGNMTRRYSPTGRFSQPDPYSGSYDFSDPQSLNRYAYVGNDPVNPKDPSGLAMACTTPDGMSGWVGDDGKCHATVVTDTRAPILISSLSHSSIVGSISMGGLLSGSRDHGGDRAGIDAAQSGAHIGNHSVGPCEFMVRNAQNEADLALLQSGDDPAKALPAFDTSFARFISGQIDSRPAVHSCLELRGCVCAQNSFVRKLGYCQDKVSG